MSSKFVSTLLIVALIVAQALSPLNPKVFASGTEVIRPDTITGTIRGQVLDVAGVPIAGARVRVTNIDNGNIRTVMTGVDGWYQVQLVPLGKYMIEASKEGFSVLDTTRPALKVELNKTVIFVPPIILGPVTSPTAAPNPPTPAPPAPSSTPGAKEEDSGRATNL